MLKKRSGLILSLIIILGCSGFAQATQFTVRPEVAVLVAGEQSQILFSKNDNRRFPPASLTKIMTVFTALETIKSGDIILQDKVTVTDAAAAMGGSQLWLAAGEELSLKDLLKATLLPSANDACVAVAQYVGGTQQNFINMMNQKAENLGLTQIHFVNSTVKVGKIIRQLMK